MRAVENTTQSVILAKKVAKRWKWAKPPAGTPKPKKGDAKGKSKGKKSKGEGSGKPEKKKEEGEKPEEKESKEGESEKKGEKDEPKKEEAEAKSAPEEAEADEPEDLPDAADLAKALAKDSIDSKRKRKIRETKFERAKYFARTNDDKIGPIKVSCTSEYTSQFIDSVRKIVPPLRRRLLMEFRGVGTHREFNKKRGEIDRESLHKVAMGSNRIFTREEPHIVPDADVTLLIDASGSMTAMTDRACTKSRLHLASQAACAFSNVLDLIGVSNECLAFTTSTGYGSTFERWWKHHRDAGGAYTRVRPLRHMIVKKADESFRQARHRFASLSQFEQCAENVDGEAVMWAARRLAARNRPGMRPILMVFSDGEPASMPEHHGLLNWHLKDTVKQIEKAGIHTVGVGIATSSVQRFYSNHLVLNDLSDLVGTSYRILREVLKNRR
jgi:cobaltochelatase CobT